MNYKVIRLLFDPRGASSKEEFRLGIIILFVLALIAISDFFTTTFFTALIGQHGAIMLASHQVIKPLLIPSLPIDFILFYCSIALAVKRVKDIGGHLCLGILTGVCVFLFFDGTFLMTITNFAMIPDSMGFEISENIRMFHIVITAIVVNLGLVALILLSILKGTKLYEKEIKKRGVLTISQFISQLGLLYVGMFILSVLITLLFDIFKCYELLITISGIVFLSIIIWYFTLVYMRVKNSSMPFYPFVICFIAYLLSFGLAVMVTFKTDNLNFINISLTFLSVLSMVFYLMNGSLFLIQDE
jgi:hypothetical protein